MLISKGVATLKALQKLRSNPIQLKQSVRNSSAGWNYRVGPPPPSKTVVLAAEIVQGFAWWWVLWHLWTEPGHVFGEFEYPDPSKWTNAELGIPED
ncbi:unnamed protein product [Brassicogethes aeneus]|uniref:NADH dehydrogenase [ubiquinone] 1 beta subcomplex subunit 2, mitochondrial n=1 Tax=Brassicogethes aeneus TaxID=1431903 RepID=A0A9P0FKX8_BRAAE|nr:unnamed protein product [Brassicogethes aeneus]